MNFVWICRILANGGEIMKVSFKVYQLPTDPGTNIDYLFDSWKYAQKLFKFSDYKEVYSGELDRNLENFNSILEELWTRFNMAIPADFEGHSMSVSDLVQFNDRYFYCDMVGWKEITDIIEKEEN